MKISHHDSPQRSAAEPKYAKSRQTGIRHQVPRRIGTLRGSAVAATGPFRYARAGFCRESDHEQ